MAHFGKTSLVIDRCMSEAEASLLAVVDKIAPWLVAIPNGLMVARATSRIFDIPQGWALIVAAALETERSRSRSAVFI